MFVDNDNQQEYTLLTPGIHRMKWVKNTITANYAWLLTFKKNGYEVSAFGKMPRLKSEQEGGTKEQWLKVVGPNGGWLVSTKIFFESIMGKDEVNRVLKEVSKKISAEYSTQDSQFESWERVMDSIKSLVTSLYEAAVPYLSNVYFDVDTEEGFYIDKEGNEKPKLQSVKPSAENGYRTPYRVSEDQTPEEEPQEDVPVKEEVPDWVNEEPKARTEPSDTEW